MKKTSIKATTTDKKAAKRTRIDSKKVDKQVDNKKDSVLDTTDKKKATSVKKRIKSVSIDKKKDSVSNAAIKKDSSIKNDSVKSAKKDSNKDSSIVKSVISNAVESLCKSVNNDRHSDIDFIDSDLVKKFSKTHRESSSSHSKRQNRFISKCREKNIFNHFNNSQAAKIDHMIFCACFTKQEIALYCETKVSRIQAHIAHLRKKLELEISADRDSIVYFKDVKYQSEINKIA